MTNAELKAIVQREEYDFLHTNKHLGSNILFLTLSGSHAYGTNVEGSDIDIRGVAGSPEILGSGGSYRGVTKTSSEEEALQQLQKHTVNYAHRITVYKKDGKTVKREVAEYDQREKEWLD